MKNALCFGVKELIYNGHLQSLGVVSVVYISVLLFMPKVVGWDIIVISYLIFEIIFLYDRYKGIDYDAKTNSERTKHILLYYDKIPYILLTMIFSAIVGVLFYSNFLTLIVSVVVCVMGILYAHYFKNLTKKINYFKNYYVATFYASMVFYPHFYYDSIPILENTLIIYVLAVFLSCFAGQVVLDVKDVDTDKHNGLKTMPVVLGTIKTIFISRVTNFISTVGLAMLGVFLDRKEFIYLGIFNLVLSYFATSMIKSKRKLGFVFTAGTFLLWSCFIITANIVV